MTRRRGALIAATAALLILGMGSRPRDTLAPPDRETCKTDLGAVFKHAYYGCWIVEDEFEPACEAGEVLNLCPEEVPCTGLDPIWCASCTDTHGARFWSDINHAIWGCRMKLGLTLPASSLPGFAPCVDEELRRSCPALTGTDWVTWYKSKFHYERLGGP
jgi:hypothetical protein